MVLMAGQAGRPVHPAMQVSPDLLEGRARLSQGLQMRFEKLKNIHLSR